MKRKRLEPNDWKFTSIIYLHLSTDIEQIIPLNNRAVRIFKPPDIEDDEYYIAEVYTPNDTYENSIAAFHGSFHYLNKVLDRVALLTFQKCYIDQAISISRYSVGIDEEFELLLTDDLFQEPPKFDATVTEHKEILKEISDNEITDAFKEIRLAINSSSIYYKFLHYYNVIERIAHFKTEKFATHKCEKCGHVNKLNHKATANKMRELFKIEGIGNSDFNKCRSLRSKIAHGSGERDQKLINKLNNQLLNIEKVAANSLSKITEIDILSGKIPRIIEQFWKIIGIKGAERSNTSPARYHIKSVSLHLKSRFNLINDVEDDEDSYKWKYLTKELPNSPEEFNVHPYAWPY